MGSKDSPTVRLFRLIQALTSVLEVASVPDLKRLPHRRLEKELLGEEKGYSKYVRPVANNSLPVNIRVLMNLYQILEVSEPSQNVKLNVWVTQAYPLFQYWTDYFLGWDPADYDGLTSAVFPWEKVWLPDTCLYNSLDVERENTERWISVVYKARLIEASRVFEPEHINSSAIENGTAKKEKLEEPIPVQQSFPSIWVADATFQYPAIYKFTCKMNILFFPFDRQHCTLTFGSWTFDSGGIDFFPDAVTFESYVENEEWSVLQFYWEKKMEKYICCKLPWALLNAKITIQRKPLFYITNLIAPTAIITLIAMVGFFMPSSSTEERTEKVNLGITTLLAMSILLLMVADQMPRTSDYVPIMGWFFLLIIILISLGTFTSSVIITIHRKGLYGVEMSLFCERLFLKRIAPVFCLKPPDGLKFSSALQSEVEIKISDYSFETNGNELKADGMGSRTDLNHRSLFNDNHLLQLPLSKSGRINPGDEMMEVLAQIKKCSQEISEALRVNEETIQDRLKWEYLARVLDRLFLILYTTLTLSVTFGFFFIGYFSSQMPLGLDDGPAVNIAQYV